MIVDPYVVAFNTPLSEVVAQMALRHIGSAIVTRRGKLAGILSAMDVCRIFAEYLDHQFGVVGGSDAGGRSEPRVRADFGCGRYRAFDDSATCLDRPGVFTWMQRWSQSRYSGHSKQ